MIWPRGQADVWEESPQKFVRNNRRLWSTSRGNPGVRASSGLLRRPQHRAALRGAGRATCARPNSQRKRRVIWARPPRQGEAPKVLDPGILNCVDSCHAKCAPARALHRYVCIHTCVHTRAYREGIVLRHPCLRASPRDAQLIGIRRSLFQSRLLILI